MHVFWWEGGGGNQKEIKEQHECMETKQKNILNGGGRLLSYFFLKDSE